MNDFSSLEKTIVRELSCRLCLCNDVSKLKLLSAEIKRKIKRLFDITIRTDDNLPKAICHECLQQVGTQHLYSVKVDKTQKFLDFYSMKSNLEKQTENPHENKLQPIIGTFSEQQTGNTKPQDIPTKTIAKLNSPPSELQQGDTKLPKKQLKKKTPCNMKFSEAMPLEEFAVTESLDKSLLNNAVGASKPVKVLARDLNQSPPINTVEEVLDSIVLIDGRPAKEGAELDKQITLFYKMECCICHEQGFNFKSLMKHYKDRHGVPGYVTCCDKKFHYFYPKKIIEHMAYHLQPNIFMCPSCHYNFHTSQQLIEHQSNGGRSEGKIACPRCSERYPTYHELGWHIVTHRSLDKFQCDYCGILLKHHHRKKTINHMENIILCSQCLRILKNIEKHEKENKEKVKAKSNDVLKLQKYQKFRQAIGLSADEDASTD